MNEHSDNVQFFIEMATDWAVSAFDYEDANNRDWALTLCMRNYRHAINIIGF
jgi:hypothetical protein